MNEYAAAPRWSQLLLIAGSLSAWGLIGWSLWNRQPIIAFSPRLSVPWIGFDVFLLAVSYLGFEIVAGGLARRSLGRPRMRRAFSGC